MHVWVSECGTKIKNQRLNTSIIDDDKALVNNVKLISYENNTIKLFTSYVCNDCTNK